MKQLKKEEKVFIPVSTGYKSSVTEKLHKNILTKYNILKKQRAKLFIQIIYITFMPNILILFLKWIKTSVTKQPKSLEETTNACKIVLNDCDY